MAHAGKVIAIEGAVARLLRVGAGLDPAQTRLEAVRRDLLSGEGLLKHRLFDPVEDLDGGGGDLGRRECCLGRGT